MATFLANEINATVREVHVMGPTEQGQIMFCLKDKNITNVGYLKQFFLGHR